MAPFSLEHAKLSEYWEVTENTTTHIYFVLNDAHQPVRYLAIALNAPLRKGLAVAIYGKTVRGVSMGEEYFLGDLRQERPVSFFKISQMVPGTTCITLYVIIRPTSEVDETVKSREMGWKDTGPFTQITL